MPRTVVFCVAATEASTLVFWNGVCQGFEFLGRDNRNLIALGNFRSDYLLSCNLLGDKYEVSLRAYQLWVTSACMRVSDK